jgi:hypothetical protein
MTNYMNGILDIHGAISVTAKNGNIPKGPGIDWYMRKTDD